MPLHKNLPLFYIIYRDSFDRIEKCMEEIGFDPNEILEVITILAAILHIGNIVSQNTISSH